tara:strand:+ start:202 stop:1026 length:825 start_codon:yes stop_codon:yes gene_type:complete
MLNQLDFISDKQILKLNSLRDYLSNLKSVCVAYSGGVDSALVATIAYEQLGMNSIAITGISPALATQLLHEARLQAKWIGIKHVEINTHELEDKAYNKNPKDRCFACKKELHKHTTHLSQILNYENVIDGVNFDDLGDFRPGIKAAKEAGVISPLARLKFSKNDIRDISKSLGLPWWDKPSQPCLSSRFPYGDEITYNRLKMVEKAEEYIRKNGIENVRVRCQGTSARIEIPSDQIQEFIKTYKRKELVNFFFEIGFKSTSLDLEGLVSGKLNR